MLYHSFGPSDKKKNDDTQIIYRTLQAKGMQIFKGIFENNSKQLVRDFFSNTFIIKLWPTICENLAFDQCFSSAPKAEIELTFRAITDLMNNSFNLDMPEFWIERFPSRQ